MKFDFTPATVDTIFYALQLMQAEAANAIRELQEQVPTAGKQDDADDARSGG